MKWDDILKVLIELEKDKYTLETRVVSKEGLPIASTLPQGVDDKNCCHDYCDALLSQ